MQKCSSAWPLAFASAPTKTATFHRQHTHPNGPWAKMLAAVKAGLPADGSGTVLDLATGPGEPANMIARKLPYAFVTASDLSEDMVAAAKKRMDGLPNVELVVADMAELPFEDGSFDVVTSCYGFMFPEDKKKACSEALRVLKPGGTLIATYWVPHTAIEPMTCSPRSYAC